MVGVTILDYIPNNGAWSKMGWGVLECVAFVNDTLFLERHSLLDFIYAGAIAHT